MSNRLIKMVSGNKYVNHSFFRPYLYIYEDLMVYKKRKKIFWVDEITMPYNHIAQVNLHKGILFSKFEIVMSGGNNTVPIKGIWNRPAKKVKEIIDNKVYHAHNKHQPNTQKVEDHIMDNIEKALSRLKELHRKQQISQREFDKRKNELLGNLHGY